MNVQQALHAFWSRFSVDGEKIRAYPSGQVPSGAPFPNMTYSVARGDAFSTLYATAFIWLQEQDGASYNEQRQQVFAQIEQEIPPEGVLIHAGDGYIMLMRSDDFLSIYNTGESVNGRPVYGGRISYRIHFLC